MSVFQRIMSRIFKGSTLAPGAAAATPAASEAQPGAESALPPDEGGRTGGMAMPAPDPAVRPQPAAPVAGSNGGAPASVDVEAVLSGLAARSPQRLDWRHSIVDLMKLVELDSSLAARKELAQELGYQGALDGSAEMNLWLHRAVMRRLAENGGRVPDDLRT